MPDTSEASTCSRPQCRSTKGEAYPYSALWQHGSDWLPWKSEGLEHGLKPHRVTQAGYVEEHGDRAPSRKKIKGVSSRQWGGRC
ncbi:MAG: hypothetical protein ABR985_15410 [Methanotrichaceae archaeon]|jgi:hypothetical protein